MVSRLKNRGVGLKLSVHAIRESGKKKTSMARPQRARTSVIGKGLVNMVPQLRSDPLAAKVL